VAPDSTAESQAELALSWLADAPLFIDGPQVSAFYDAVVRPEHAEGTVKISVSGSHSAGSTTSVEGGAEASIGGFLAALLPGLKASAKAGHGRSREEMTGDEQSIELNPINNPQRQLIHLTLHYQTQQAARWRITRGFDDLSWAEPDYASGLPRALLFLDVPPLRPILPAALEKADGTVTAVFENLAPEGQSAPPYPAWHMGADLGELQQQRRDYWKWFADNYSDTRAMLAVERAAEGSHGIRWIDYRLPLDDDGRTLHLHVQGRATYDTGTFAYNFIKRGFKHGLRVVGTLKSEPDLNVLAIFEK
jgi:hypothetical protein